MSKSYDLTDPSKPTIIKAVGATLDYSQSWKVWLAKVGDTIASATVTVEGTLAKQSEPVITDGVVSLLISGGTVGKVHRVLFTIVTPTRTDQRSIYLKIVDR
jgi:hypothetical protein